MNAAPESAHGRPGAGAPFLCENSGVECGALKVAGVGNAMIGEASFLSLHCISRHISCSSNPPQISLYFRSLPSHHTLSLLNSCMADGHPRSSHAPISSLSGPLYAVYSESAENKDNIVFKAWQKDADGIIFFVSPRSLSTLCILIRGLNRMVYFPP